MAQASTTNASNVSTLSQRLLSLDAFRGITILAMILVNNPGDWGAMYWPLGHAAWHGWTPTDLIFPFFLFIVGTSLAYSLRKYRELGGATPELYARIIRRTCILFLLGVGMALFGHICDLVSGKSDSLGLDHLRYLGVLQRIALVYFAVSLVALHIRIATQVILAATLLLGYWALLAWYPSSNDYASNLSPDGNVVRVVDLKVLGARHMYTQAGSEKTEPEGLLSTLPAIATAMLGYWTGLIIQRRGPNWHTVALLAACGLALAALGLLWDQIFPINKKLWTSSFVLLTGGLAMVGLAACLALFDIAGFRKLGRPFEIVGVNAITVFVGSGLLARLLATIKVNELTEAGWTETSVKGWMYKNLFTDHFADPKVASLGFALLSVAVWWLTAWVMARRGWSLKV